jgi:hypothetical protein
MHLRVADFIDIAEGTRSEASAPHLAECASCRSKLTELRATMAAAKDVDVPEPSPLFWDHFSQRVHDAVAAGGGRGTTGWLGALRRLSWRRVTIEPMAVIAIVGIATFVVVPRMFRSSSSPRPDVPSRSTLESPVAPRPTAGMDLPADATIDSDPSLSFVAELVGMLGGDADETSELEDVASAEHAVSHLTDGELRELQRLLEAELSRSGD